MKSAVVAVLAVMIMLDGHTAGMHIHESAISARFSKYMMIHRALVRGSH